jgi:hypothetical protein
MFLGIRRVRSAGRTSGSVEITLPALLQVLEGVKCRLVMRDGARPEIVLQPDLTAAQNLFQTLWQKIRQGLGEIGDLPDFSMADFSLAFFPAQHWQERPPLAYADALAVLQKYAQTPLPASFHAHQSDADVEGEEEALSRLLAFMTVTASYHLSLQGRFALAFGDAVAYLITGNPTSLGTDFERGMAHRLFWSELPSYTPGSPFDDQTWQQARPAFRRVFDQFFTWQESPSVCMIARDQWYRALTVELKSL